MFSLTLRGNANSTVKATRPERVNALFSAAAFKTCTRYAHSWSRMWQSWQHKRDRISTITWSSNSKPQYIRAPCVYIHIYANSLNSNCLWSQFLKGPKGFSQGTTLPSQSNLLPRSDTHYTINMTLGGFNHFHGKLLKLISCKINLSLRVHY